jgi:hypothetical protein
MRLLSPSTATSSPSFFFNFIHTIKYAVHKPPVKKRKKQCCGSGMFIPDPTTATKEKGEKLVVRPFFGGQKYHTI